MIMMVMMMAMIDLLVDMILMKIWLLFSVFLLFLLDLTNGQTNRRTNGQTVAYRDEHTHLNKANWHEKAAIALEAVSDATAKYVFSKISQFLMIFTCIGVAAQKPYFITG